MPRIMNIRGTCPAQMMVRKEPMSTMEETKRMRKERYLVSGGCVG
jgi:hypothetical protein